MEVRLIKTCQGFQKVVILDGALVHPNVEVFGVGEHEFMGLRTLRTQPLENLELSEEEALKEIIRRVMIADLPIRKMEGWKESRL